MAKVLQAPLGEVVAHISQALMLTLDAPVIAVGAVAPAARAALHQALLDLDVPPALVELHEVDDSPASIDLLKALNQQRDARVAHLRLLVLVVDAIEDRAFISRYATDLVEFEDLIFEIVSPEAPADLAVLDAAIRERMIEAHQYLDMTGLLPADVARRPFALRDLYMELFLDPPPEQRRARQLERVLTETLLGTPVTPPDDGPPPTPQVTPWLVLGDPGAGKTTLLRHLALCYAEQDTDPLGIGACLPVLIPLADVAIARERRIVSFGDFLADWLGVAPATMLALIGRTLLLLDGLDEIPTRETRQDILSEILSFQEEHSPHGLIVTARTFCESELPHSGRMHLHRAYPPSDTQIGRYVERFLSLRHDDEAYVAQKSTAFIDAIAADTNLSDLVQTPLLLVFLVLLFDVEGRLPTRRVLLYHRLVEVLTARWRRMRSIARRPGRSSTTPGELLRIFGPLAWRQISSGNQIIHQDDIRETVTQSLVKKGAHPREAEEDAQLIVESMREETVILRPVGAEEWVFLHQTIAEYLAGVEMSRKKTVWDQVLVDPFRPKMREVAIFCAGELAHIRAEDERIVEFNKVIFDKCNDKVVPLGMHSFITSLLLEQIPVYGGGRQPLARCLVKIWFLWDMMRIDGSGLSEYDIYDDIFGLLSLFRYYDVKWLVPYLFREVVALIDGNKDVANVPNMYLYTVAVPVSISEMDKVLIVFDDLEIDFGAGLYFFVFVVGVAKVLPAEDVKIILVGLADIFGVDVSGVFVEVFNKIGLGDKLPSDWKR